MAKKPVTRETMCLKEIQDAFGMTRYALDNLRRSESPHPVPFPKPFVSKSNRIAYRRGEMADYYVAKFGDDMAYGSGWSKFQEWTSGAFVRQPIAVENACACLDHALFNVGGLASVGSIVSAISWLYGPYRSLWTPSLMVNRSLRWLLKHDGLMWKDVPIEYRYGVLTLAIGLPAAALHDGKISDEKLRKVAEASSDALYHKAVKAQKLLEDQSNFLLKWLERRKVENQQFRKFIQGT